ncbi:hypothetical protein HMPREF0765_2488 [Sphingobacterium spiritivorum ATCC 33300]|uniref:Uncharacterized protein n=1 Tax=Sphingobacterium spiritivorum ATCC 33300 TaxID=525372 RepID=C2FYT2_SPHSI|nr:hypothetical protein [Sphingobacterium spiritivorum]EEI91917.1 hypothetical protein HMPREF0765_2488 [Sphingobacterium spiritivorum ATCC 33300]QQS97073.1 hypothetical protein I6J03_05000 [Sphingobacterium spiritivorum]
MRKWIAAVLLLIYSLTTSGAAFYFHICGNDQEHIISVADKSSHKNCPLCTKKAPSEASKKSGSCHTDAKPDKKHVCKDVVVDLEKASDNYYSNNNQIKNFNLFTPSIITLLWVYNFNIFEELAIEHQIAQTNSTALVRQQDSYLLHCNFRI